MYKQEFLSRGRVLLLIAAVMFWFVGTAQAQIVGETGNTFNFTAKADHISTGEGNSVLFWGFTANGTRPQ